jgi:hypothetical protein
MPSRGQSSLRELAWKLSITLSQLPFPEVLARKVQLHLAEAVPITTILEGPVEKHSYFNKKEVCFIHLFHLFVVVDFILFCFVSLIVLV